MSPLEKYRKEPKIAYFSMEIGIKDDIPTFSGGLGVLAGDTVKSAADLNLPFVAVTLVSRKGYFKQDIDDKRASNRIACRLGPGQVHDAFA